MRLFFLLVALSLLSCSRKEDQRPVRTDPEPAVVAPPSAQGTLLEPVALVELFTSEGCSSCPPADRNLTRIAYAARDDDRRVIALSFHVDYWNYIGWTDPFSSVEYSERQRRYAKRLGSGVYTPQMVVGGREHFLGSSGDKADAAILRALTRPASHGIALVSTDGQRVAFEVTGPTTDASIYVAVAQGASGIKVQTGENAGRSLSHVNVVRSLSSERARVPARGQLALKVPVDVDRASAMVVGWVEDAKTGHVLGAVAKSGLLVSRSP